MALLAEPGRTVLDVSIAVGFDNVSSFTRAFTPPDRRIAVDLPPTRHRHGRAAAGGVAGAGQPPRASTRRPRLTFIASLRGIASTISTVLGTL